MQDRVMGKNSAHFMQAKLLFWVFFNIAVVLLEIEFAGQILASMPIAANTRGH